MPGIVAITRPEQAGGFDGSDFSAETIARRAAEGYAEAARALDAPRVDHGIEL